MTTPLNPDAFDLACKELFLTITAHKSATDVLGFDWKSLKASTRKPWETATRKVLTAYLEAEGTTEELHEINTRLARILTDTANALKGEPEPLTSHSWHDLAEVAKRAVDGLREQVDAQSVDDHLTVAQPEVNSVDYLATPRGHYDAWTDTGDGYTQRKGWTLTCLWCRAEFTGDTKREALEGYEAHEEKILKVLHAEDAGRAAGRPEVNDA